MAIGKKEIDRRFESHPVNEEQSANIAAVTAKFKSLAMWIDKNVENPREAASALTHLEQAKFFTVAGVSRPVVGVIYTQESASVKKVAAPKAAKAEEAPAKVDGRSKAAREAKAAAAAESTPAPTKKGPRRPIAQ